MRKASSQVQSEALAECDEPPRDRHGFRGLPPPATFSLSALPDDAMLNETETAATLRLSTNTLGSWRQQPDHPLKWLALPNGFVRYMVSAIRAYLALGQPRPRRRKHKDAGPPPTTDPAARKPKRARRSSRRRADQPASKQDPRSNAEATP